VRAGAAKARPSNLPVELTSFVGRRQELREVKRLLTTTRLLTLTGSGGVGKTRLALRAAAEMARGFPDGGWFVPLESIDDPLLVSQAVFAALGAQDQSAARSLSTLTDYLAGKRLLLVLDNCEHLLDASAILASTLLRGCPELQLLATSRQALGVAGEVRMPVPPMSLPPQGDEALLSRLTNSEAVRLLSERAAAVVPGFGVNAENAAPVLQLCQRLDGIPLALELAAVRLGALSLDQLNQGLAGELSILGRGNRGAEVRQQTLEATIGWSYGLLDDVERLLWARLSVFARGFDAEAAIEVCSDERVPSDRVVELLGALVDKSIVKRDLRSGNAPRYWLLDTVRQYGRQRLREIHEEKRTQERHVEWIGRLARSIGAFDNRQVELFKRMDLERDNLWAALEFCLRDPGEIPQAAQWAQHLLAYWTCRGPFGDLRRVLTSLADQAPEDSPPRAHLLRAAAVMANSQNDFDAAVSLGRESLRIGTQLKDSQAMALSLAWLAIPLGIEGRTAEALEAAESAVALARLMQARPIELVATAVLCNVLATAGEPERAVKLGEHCLTMSRERGELWARGYLLMAVSQAHWLRGERPLAETHALEGATCKHALDDRAGLQALLETLAWMAAERGAHQRAATLFGCAQRVRQSSAIQFQEGFRQQHDRSMALVLRGLGKRVFDSTYGRGLAMTIDDAIAFAVDEKLPPRPVAVKARTRISLTRRELEIARMIADDMSNREIASQLFLSERTVETHVTHMFDKLGLNSRVQLTRWLAGVGDGEPIMAEKDV
jgi:predicted ATPase/DNA-binding CsgD family transcriptional regulator